MPEIICQIRYPATCNPIILYYKYIIGSNNVNVSEEPHMKLEIMELMWRKNSTKIKT